MGNRFSRRRDVPVSSAETVVTQQKTSVQPVTSEPAEESAVTPAQEVAQTEKLDALVEEPVTSVACSPKNESTSECTEAEIPARPAPVNESEPEVKETPAAVDPEPLSSSKAPEPEPIAAQKPFDEAQFTPEPAPEPVPEFESVSCLEADTKAALEPISESEPAPAEALEQHTELPTQDSLPEPALSSPLLIDFGVLDVTPSPAPVPVLLSPDEPSNISAGEQCKGIVEAAESATLEPEKSTEMSEFLEEQIEVEAGEIVETLGSDVNNESLSEILKNSELKGNDLHNDFIPSDVKIPDDTPIMDIELM